MITSTTELFTSHGKHRCSSGRQWACHASRGVDSMKGCLAASARTRALSRG